MVKIAVIGSINMDLVVETDVSPKSGETVLGKNFFMSPGGKGNNQAVAAARLGSNVSMFGCVGNDDNGKLLVKNLKNENINTEFIKSVEDKPTGVAVIELCDGDNSIVVVSGANNCTNIEYVKSIQKELLKYDIIIMQMEIPMDAVKYLIEYLHENSKTILLNPAPAIKLNKDIIDKVTYLTPNEHEYKIVLDTKQDIDSALHEYPNKLIITEGEAGVEFFDGNNLVNVPCIDVKPIDTTGAGDTFSAALGVALAKQNNLKDSIRFANIAAGLSVTRKGAQGGMPTLGEVEMFEKARE